MSDLGKTAALPPSALSLRAAELFAGLPDEDLEHLATAARQIELGAGEILWRQGAEADGLYVIQAGEVVISSRLPGERETELVRLGPGEALGELALIDGGRRSAGARTTESTTLVFLSRPDFVALISSLLPSAFAVRASILTVLEARLRRRHSALAASLGASLTAAAPAETAFEQVPSPPMAYLARLPFFSAFQPTDISALLDRGRLVAVSAHTLLVTEGAMPACTWLTVSGAVERVIARDDQRIRVGLSGPGRASGYLAPSTTTDTARERAVLLELDFADLHQNAFSRLCLDALQRELAMTLREAERPQARLTAAGDWG